MNKSFQLGWWLILITVASTNAFAFGITYLFPDTNIYLVSAVGEIGLLIPIIIGILYAKKRGVNPSDMLSFNEFSPRAMLPSAVMTLGCQIFISFALFPIMMLLIFLFGAETNTSMMDIPSTSSELIIAFVTLCVVAPIMEEFLCRGVLFKLFEPYGFYVCIISSALAFTMLHFELRTFLQVFFIGILFAMLRMTTGSTLLTIILHSLNNLSSLIQMISLNQNTQSVFGTSVPFICSFLFPFIAFYMFYRKRSKFNLSQYRAMPKKKTGFSVGLLLVAIMFVAYNIYLLYTRIVEIGGIENLISNFSIY